MDLAMSINYYDEKLKESFNTENLNISLLIQLGRKRNSLEFRLCGCEFTYDIFFLYKISPTRYCSYYHASSIIP